MKNKQSLRKVLDSTLGVLTVLFVCALVSVAAMQVLSKVISGELKNAAFKEANLEARYLKTTMNALFLSSDWVVNSYLSGIVDLEVEDQTDTSYTVRYIYKDKDLKNLKVDDLYNKLKSFLSYNDDFSSAAFVFEPQVIKDTPNGIAAQVNTEGMRCRDLLESVDIFQTDRYNTVKQRVEPYMSGGLIAESKRYVMTRTVPLLNEREEMIGQFWVDIPPVYISEVIEDYSTEKDLFAVVLSEQMTVLASSDGDRYNGCDLKEVMQSRFGEDVPEEWDRMVKSYDGTQKDYCFHQELAGMYCWTYIYPLVRSSFRLLVLKSEEKILDRQKHLVWRFWIVAVSFLFLLVLCLLHLFTIFRKSIDAKRRMESELDVAAKIQSGILPPNLDHSSHPYDIYGFQRPAKSVGGDLFCYERKGKYLHFCIGDVSGKGVPSSLVMAEICSLYSYIIERESAPEKIMHSLNDAVMEHDDEMMFCTLFLGVLNLETGMVEFCNAGHNPPVLIRRASSPEYMKIKPNMPVYAFEGYDYQKESLVLDPGDRLFLYTDGVTEAKTAKSEFYGSSMLLSALAGAAGNSLRNTVDTVLSDVDKFVDGAEQNDDITMLCIEYKSKL